MKKYNTGYIPSHIKKMLAEYLQVQDLQSLSGNQLTEKYQQITRDIQKRYKGNEKVYRDYFTIKKNVDGEYVFFDRKTLKNYFTIDKYRIDRSNLYALLLAMDIDKDEWDQLIDLYRMDKDTSWADLLSGSYNVYLYDSLETQDEKYIKCVPLWLINTEAGSKAKNMFAIRFKSPGGTIYSGDGQVLNNNTLILDIYSDEVHIFMCCELPPKVNKGINHKWILSAAVVSNGLNGRPIKATVVLVSNNTAAEKDVDNYMKREIVSFGYVNTLRSDSKDQASGDVKEQTHPDGLKNDERNEIVLYLSRDVNRDRTISPVLPNSFGELKKRNMIFEKEMGRDGYDRLKIKFDNKKPGFSYFSFTRIRTSRSEVAVSNYDFSFNDSERTCKVTRHRIGQREKIEFYGEATLENEMVYFSLRNNEIQHRKQVIAPFAQHNDQGLVLRAITSTVSAINAQHMGLRELIVYLPNEALELDTTEKLNGFIKYIRFKEIKDIFLRPEDKLYMADRNNCTLSYPAQSNINLIYSRQDKSRKYSGVYLIFIKNSSDKRNRTLQRIILEIDSLAQVSLLIKFEDSSQVFKYSGECEFYNHNLRITAFLPGHISEQKSLVLVFDYIKEWRNIQQVYSGVALNTDDEDMAVSYSFIAIREDAISKNASLIQKTNHSNTEPGILEMAAFKSLLKTLSKGPSSRIKNSINLLDLNPYKYFWVSTNFLR